MNDDLPKKILITGAVSFIGRYVIEYLSKSTDIELVTTSLESEKDIQKYEWLNDTKYIQCDLSETMENYFDFFEKPNLMLHFCWAGLPHYRDLAQIDNNLFSQYSFISNMVKNGLKDMAISGTCYEYGKQEGCLSEDINTLPEIPYALAKDTLRILIDALKRHYDFKYKWIRIFYIYGKEQSRKSLFSLLDEAIERNDRLFNMSGGEQIRDYLPVEQAAEYIAKIALQNDIDGIINCCSGKPRSLIEIVTEYLCQKEKKIKLNLGHYPYLDFEPMAFWGDTTKLDKILAKSNLDNGGKL